MSAIAPGPYNSTHLLPVPKVDQPYGGTQQHPTYYWNASLPEDDVVYGTGFANITRSCCPYAIGITTDYLNGCRMHNTTENEQWFQNCTKQIWQEAIGRPQDWRLSNSSFTRQLKITEYQESRQLGGRKGVVTCTTIGGGEPEVVKLGFVSRCCDKAGGKQAGLTWDGSEPRPPAAGANFVPFECEVKNNQRAKWNECMAAEHAYSLCGRDTGAGFAIGPIFGSWTGSGFLIAAVALAALV